ncbi:MAG: hypothetical protein EP321_11305 [Sphingomonadales bacterium]|nr:MAG: hypothetical protein EP345_01670 [Sphingomonadales bacterium]TNF03160.1 MAG: hypothetical protein EP321_11305 [Sphingomonadales bacterium]
MPWSMFNQDGRRKYLTHAEMQSFLHAAEQCSPEVHSFGWMLAVTGCRISEALAMTRENIDFETKHVIIRCLKKRGKQVFRAVPLPVGMLDMLSDWFDAGKLPDGPLWPWSRMTGYRRICEIMDDAGLTGECATPKGLRHGFAVMAIQAKVPLNLVQRWLGHADIKTTAIYTSAMGAEEREIAARMWDVSGIRRSGKTRNNTNKNQEKLQKKYDKSTEIHKITEINIKEKPSNNYTFSEKKEITKLKNEEEFHDESKIYTPPCLMIQFWLYCNRSYQSKTFNVPFHDPIY